MKYYTTTIYLLFLSNFISDAILAQQDAFDMSNTLELTNCRQIDQEKKYQYPPRVESFNFDPDEYSLYSSFAQESIARKPKDYRFKGFTNLPGSKSGIQVINKLQGLPGSFVIDMITDNERNVWMYIELVGLVRFDGFNFKVYSSGEGLVSDHIIKLEPKKQGRGIWIITEDGISEFDGLVFRNLFFEEDITSEFITSSSVQGDTLWLGTRDNGLWSVSGEEIRVFEKNAGLASNMIESVYCDSEGKIWISHSNGTVEYLKDSSVSRLYLSSKIEKPVLLGEHQNGFYIYDRINKIIQNYVGGVIYETELDIPENKRLQYKFSRDGIWFITHADGIFKYNNEEFCAFKRGEELPSYFIEASTIVDNQIWISSYGKGINLLRSLDYNYFDQEKGEINELGKSFYSSDGQIYFGADNALFKVENEFMQLKEIELVKNHTQKDRFYSFAEDTLKTVWTMSIEGHLYKEEGDKFVEQYLVDSYGIEDVFDIEFDLKDNLWIATWGNGLYCLGKDGKLKDVPTNVEEDERILEMELDDQNNLWLATPRGILRQVGSEFKRYDLSNFPIENSFSLFKDRNGWIWIGAKRGVAIYDGKEFKFLNRNTGLLSDIVVSIAEDSKGRIWLTTELGINVIEDFDVWEQTQIHSFTYEDGMNELEYYYNSSIFSKDDLLWMLGPSGLVVINTNNISFDLTYFPEVYLDQVNVNETSIDFFQLNDENRRKAYTEEMSFQLDLDRINIKNQSQVRFSGDYSFPHDYNSFSFSFTARQWRSSFDIEYRYRLLGLVDTWSKPTKEKSVNYWKLPGFSSYTFEVQSRIKGGKWSDTEQFNFRIRGNRWLVFGVVVFILFLGSCLGYILKTRKHLKKNSSEKNLREELSEHIKINDAVLNNLNPESASSLTLEEQANFLASKMKKYGAFNLRVKQLAKDLGNLPLSKSLESELKDISTIEELWDNFNTLFNSKYPEFNLQIGSNGIELSEREINICKLILAGLRNPDIANILFIQTDSVKKARQRLTKKLNDAGFDFESYMDSLASTGTY